MSENEQILKGIDDPEYPIYEMYTDENGNPVAHISRKVTILTQEESKRVLERFKNLEAENEKLRKLFTDFWKWADPPFALKSGTFEQFMEICDRAYELSLIECPA